MIRERVCVQLFSLMITYLTGGSSLLASRVIDCNLTTRNVQNRENLTISISVSLKVFKNTKSMLLLQHSQHPNLGICHAGLRLSVTRTLSRLLT